MNKINLPEIKNKLVYKSNLLVNKFDITNIVLIDDNVSNFEMFFNSTNNKSFPIVYNGNCLRTELESLLKEFNSIDRMCFVFDEKRIPVDKLFINYSPFFKLEDLNKDNLLELSENFRLLINMLGKLQVQFIDFLACNSLQYPNFVNFYKKIKYFIKKEFGYDITIGASDDKTGNITWGGDWILESTGVDIKDIYFTPQIENYSHLLANGVIINFSSFTSIDVFSQSGIMYWRVSGTFTSTPIYSPTVTLISDGSTECTINITTNITPEFIFICGSNHLTFNGNNNVVTINGQSEFMGLVQNGFSSNSGIKSNITIKNIILQVNSSTLAEYAGWIACQYFGFGSCSDGEPTCLITNCSSDGDLNYYCGGIVGANCTCKVTHCNSSGNIVYGSGGIVGAYANGYNEETVDDRILKTIVENSYSTGNINDSGGIFGSYCNSYKNDSFCTASNCYSLAESIDENSGGIYGANTNYQSNSTCTANYCFSIGTISNGSGGIFCAYCNMQSKDDALCEANYCYSKGDISLNSGGIFGSNSNDSTPMPLSLVFVAKCIANYCYSTGKVNASSGGIFGISSNSNATYSESIVNNCYVLCTGNTNEENYGTFFAGSCNVSALGCSCQIINSYAITSNPNMFGSSPNFERGNTCVSENVGSDYPYWTQSSANTTIGLTGSANWFIYNSGYPFLLSGFTVNFYSGTTSTVVRPDTWTTLTVNPSGSYYELFNEVSGVTVGETGQLKSTITGTQNFIVLQSLGNFGDDLALNLYRYNFVNFSLIVENSIVPNYSNNTGNYFLEKINRNAKRKFRLF
jgi:hypothetical protein